MTGRAWVTSGREENSQLTPNVGLLFRELFEKRHFVASGTPGPRSFPRKRPLDFQLDLGKRQWRDGRFVVDLFVHHINAAAGLAEDFQAIILHVNYPVIFDA